MMETYQMVCMTGGSEIRELTLYLAQSDNLHMLEWLGRSSPEVEVFAECAPLERRPFRLARIVREFQQVFEKSIAALEPRRA